MNTVSDQIRPLTYGIVGIEDMSIADRLACGHGVLAAVPGVATG